MGVPDVRQWVRRLAPIAVALGMLVAQVGCVQITPTPEPAIVTFACSEEEEEHFKPLIEAFRREHPYITIELVRPRRYQWPEADVWEAGPFTRRFMEQSEIEVLDLTPFVEQGDEFDREDFYPGTIDRFTDEDLQIWGVPYMIDVTAMYYNRDLFDEYAVDHPQPEWTWDDFVQAGRALYDPVDGVYGYVPDEQYNDALAFVYQNGGRIFDDLANPTRTTFDDPLTVEALDWFAKLMFEHEAVATPYQARQAYGIGGYTQIGIEQGRLGMWADSLSNRGGRLDREGWDVDWGIVPLPKGAHSATFAYLGGYVISEQAPSPDACWQWIAYLTRQIPRYGVPVRKSLIASEAFENEVGADVAAVARTSVEHALLFSPAAWDIYGTFQIFNEALAKLYGGEVTALEAMSWAQEKSQYK
jgi:multiple sugar transport system substrate-binding protein